MTNPTAARIQDAAMARFAAQGFDGTSLVEIASDVGIKAPSIYAHFRSKDALYLSLIPLLIQAELAYARDSLLKGRGAVRGRIRQYLRSIKLRFDESYRVKFWMRTLAGPPLHIYQQVLEPLHGFMDDLEGILRTAIEQSELLPNRHGLSAPVLARTCMSLIDSLQSELVHGGPLKYERRIKAVWAVFDAAVVAMPKAPPDVRAAGNAEASEPGEPPARRSPAAGPATARRPLSKTAD